jgi:hypothetical protein
MVEWSRVRSYHSTPSELGQWRQRAKTAMQSSKHTISALVISTGARRAFQLHMLQLTTADPAVMDP